MISKVFHLTSVHDPYDTRILRRECITLSNEGYDVYLINAKGISTTYQNVKLHSVCESKGRLHRFTVAQFKILFFSMKNKADIYHIHDPELVFSGFLLSLFGKSVIYDCHENYTQKIRSRSWVPKIFKSLFSSCIYLAFKFLTSKFKLIFIAEEGLGKQFYGRKVELLRNYPDLSLFKSTGKSSNKITGQIFYSGGLVPDKGIEEVICSIISSPRKELKLIIVGKSDPVVLLRQTENLKDKRISYLGQVSFEEMLFYLYQSEVAVVCNQDRFSYQTALPNKIFEYMAAGVPSVYSDFKLWNDLSKDHPFGLSCKESDPKDILKKITMILDDSDLRITLSRNALKLCENYDWSNESSTLIYCYKEILSGNKE